MKIRFHLFISIAVLFSCFKTFQSEEGEDFFYVRRLDARFPVWVKGNLKSDAFIVIVHGGPGSSGTQYFHFGAFDKLQKDYAVVYWEQRASGFSQGQGSGGQNHLNAEEASQDLEAVIDVIQHKYQPKSIFIMGHSWGGVLTTCFLGNKPERQNKVKGWILINGGHHWSLGQVLSVEWVRNRAHQFLSGTAPSRFNDQHWRKALDWYDNHPLGDWEKISSMSWIQKHIRYVDDADGYFLPENRDEVIRRTTGGRGLSLQNAFGFYGAWAWFTKGNPPLWDSQKVITTDQMHHIKLPTLITWGRHDGILPVTLAQDAYDRIATPALDKYIIIYEQTAHSPMFEETEKFNLDVKNFVEKYR